MKTLNISSKRCFKRLAALIATYAQKFEISMFRNSKIKNVDIFRILIKFYADLERLLLRIEVRKQLKRPKTGERTKWKYHWPSRDITGLGNKQIYLGNRTLKFSS